MLRFGWLFIQEKKIVFVLSSPKWIDKNDWRKFLVLIGEMTERQGRWIPNPRVQGSKQLSYFFICKINISGINLFENTTGTVYMIYLA